MTQPFRPHPVPPTVVVQQSRNTLIGYLLWFFLGHLGVHRMYVGKWLTGVVQLVLFWGGTATSWLLIGFVPLGVWFVWWIVDAIILPAQIRAKNDEEARRALAPRHRTF